VRSLVLQSMDSLDIIKQVSAVLQEDSNAHTAAAAAAAAASQDTSGPGGGVAGTADFGALHADNIAAAGLHNSSSIAGLEGMRAAGSTGGSGHLGFCSNLADTSVAGLTLNIPTGPHAHTPTAGAAAGAAGGFGLGFGLAGAAGGGGSMHDLSPARVQGQCGSSTELVRLGSMHALLEQQQQRRHSSNDVRGLQRASCWASSSSLAGTSSQPGSATAATAAGPANTACFQPSPRYTQGSMWGTVEDSRGVVVPMNGGACGLQQPGTPGVPGPVATGAAAGGAGAGGWGLGGAAPGQQQGLMPCYTPAAMHSQFGGLCASTAAVAAQQGLCGPHDGLDMFAPMCQPRDVVVVTRATVPSQDQILALLAAPLPREPRVTAAPRTANQQQQQCMEVSLYKENGPHPLLPEELVKQLQQRGLPSKLAAARASGTLSDRASYHSCLKEDLETFLMHLSAKARCSPVIGRVVIVLRVGGEGGGGVLSFGQSKTGLIIAASSSDKMVAESMVMGLLGEMESVLQLVK